MTSFIISKILEKVPVLLILFNRPNYVEELLNSLDFTKISRLYVWIDGPRTNNFIDFEAQKLILNRLKELANCDLIIRHSKVNLGCKKSVSSAIFWFFDLEECGIVFEDDVIPCSGAIDYFIDALNFFKDDKNVALISGYNPITYRTQDSFIFSKFPFIWGWASWSDRVLDFDVNAKYLLSEIDTVVDSWFSFTNDDVKIAWKKVVNESISGELDTWDYLFGYYFFSKEMFSIIPPYSIVRNIGFDTDATHTASVRPFYVRFNSLRPVSFVPAYGHWDINYDKSVARFLFGKLSNSELLMLYGRLLLVFVINKLKNVF